MAGEAAGINIAMARNGAVTRVSNEQRTARDLCQRLIHMVFSYRQRTGSTPDKPWLAGAPGTCARIMSTALPGLAELARAHSPHSQAASSASSFCSSPDLYMSTTMSQPPTSSPLTYNCGKVGQFE